MTSIWEYYYIKVFNLRHKLGFKELNEPFMSLLVVCMIDCFVWCKINSVLIDTVLPDWGGLRIEQYKFIPYLLGIIIIFIIEYICLYKRFETIRIKVEEIKNKKMWNCCLIVYLTILIGIIVS